MKKEETMKLLVEKTEEGYNIEIKGMPHMIMTGISILVKNLKDEKILSEKMIRKSVDVGLMSNEEIAKEATNELKKFIDKLFE